MLATGIVVDDAIVVVENVERKMESGLNALAAAHTAMKEVTRPIISIMSVLCAVFIPVAFLGGIEGQFYRQFAVTITASTIISTLNSLTLSPALAALLLKPRHAPADRLQRGLDRIFGRFFAWFNRTFAASSERYARGVRAAIAQRRFALAVFTVLLLCTWLAFRVVPTGFVPAQDKQYLVAVVQLPDAASLDRTAAQAQLRDAQVTVTGEVARNYFVLRGLQEQLAVATRNARNQEQTLELTRVRLDAGRGTELDRSRAETQLKMTLASIRSCAEPAQHAGTSRRRKQHGSESGASTLRRRARRFPERARGRARRFVCAGQPRAKPDANYHLTNRTV